MLFRQILFPLPEFVSLTGDPNVQRRKEEHAEEPNTENRALNGGVFDGMSPRAELIDIFEHDYADLYRHSEKRQEAYPGGNAKVRPSD